MQRGMYDIGKETMTCGCGAEIKTGGKEWNDSGGFRKGWLYFKTYFLQGAFPYSLVSMVGGGMFELFLQEVFDVHLEPIADGLGTYSILAAFISLCIFVFFMYRIHKVFQEEVRDSTNRNG
jgi:hypothetical protein